MKRQQWVLGHSNCDYMGLARRYNINPNIARLLCNRGIKDEEMGAYLSGGLEMTHSPLLMKDMDKATDIIISKIKEGKKIRVIGDYDVDGVTATYILVTALKKAGGDISYEIPNRFLDGYGINVRIIEDAKNDGVDTILTCDNGIAALPAITRGKELGMTIVVTDHHEPKEFTVPADAIVDIKQEDCHYPYKEICGATVAYKFIKCVYEKMGLYLGEEEYIDIVAIATVQDVMRLRDESRIYVKEGMKILKRTENLGLRALMTVKDLDRQPFLTAYHLGFVIGPCINASGRLETADLALQLLMSETMEEAFERANELAAINEARKEMTDEGLKKAIEYVENNNLDETCRFLVVFVENMGEGIIGIVAGKIKEKYYKPTIVFTNSEEHPEILKGSARSVADFDINAALERVKEYHLGHGGHKGAAGLACSRDRLLEFAAAVNNDPNLTDEVLTEEVYVDCDLHLGSVNEELIKQIDLMGPFGEGNKKPVFVDVNIKIKSARIVGANKRTIQIEFIDGQNIVRKGIYFDAEGLINDIKLWFTDEECDKMLNGRQNSVALDIIYEPQINEFRDTRTIQFVVKNYRKTRFANANQ